jgi:hypothetical protein
VVTELTSYGNGSAKIGSQGRLNIIFHGAFAFFLDRDKEHLIAEVPNLPHHVYRAGSWLAETEIRGPGVVYTLNKKSVAGGTAWLNPDENVIVNFKFESDKQRPEPFTRFVLPRPASIKSLRISLVPAKFFEGKGTLVKHQDPQPVALMQVLTYDILDDSLLSINAKDGEGHYWEPAFTDDHVNLHIHSAEEHYHKIPNAEEDFNRCMQLFGVDLRLQTMYLPALPIPAVEVEALAKLGIAPEETEDLGVRTLRMARLGRLKVQSRDTNVAWFGNDALDGNPRACGGGGGDGN